jgi:hypothetical protein
MSKHGSEQVKQPAEEGNGDSREQTPTEKPEPDDKAKERAAEMMAAYEDRPTLVLPGSGGAISGTAVNDWLDEDGNCKYGDDADARAANANAADDGTGSEDQIAKDKAFNEAVIKAGKARAADDEKAASK